MVRRAFGIVTVGVLLAAAGCTSEPVDRSARSETSVAGPSTTTSAAADAPAQAEVYTGDLEGFYRVPKPFPEGEPGELIRVQELGSSGGRATVRVMYHSVDGAGHDRAVTGLVTHPTGEAPPDGWPVISTAHGTTGVASPCAPSRTVESAPGWGVDGVWAMTDYIGLGPVGELHPYLSKWSEGNAVIDIVRAARALPGAHAGSRWISIGHSQGGHGALAAHELAADHAPELDLVATVALSPAAMLDRVYGGVDPVVTTILTMMALVSAESEHPDLDIADYLSPGAVAAADTFRTSCLDAITEEFIPIALDGAFGADPRQTEPARSIILENDVGSQPVDGVPVFTASGTEDDRVVIERFRDLTERLCAAGQVTEIQVIDGADHGSILPATAADVTAFIEGALDGRAPTDSCPS